MLDVPAFEGSRNVRRQLKIERINCDSEGPILGWHVEQQEAQRERYVESRGQTAQKLHSQQSRQVRRERSQQGNKGKRDGRADQYTSRPKGGTHPNGWQRNQHLGGGLYRGDPRPLVESCTHSAAYVSKTERGQSPIQRRYECAHEHCNQPEP